MTPHFYRTRQLILDLFGTLGTPCNLYRGSFMLVGKQGHKPRGQHHDLYAPLNTSEWARKT